jgi:hypothetical protein
MFIKKNNEFDIDIAINIFRILLLLLESPSTARAPLFEKEVEGMSVKVDERFPVEIDWYRFPDSGSEVLVLRGGGRARVMFAPDC